MATRGEAGGKRRRWPWPWPWPWLLAWVSMAVVATAMIAAYFIPLPYYIYAPGEAESLQPLITVQGGHKTAKGAFMLTTILDVYAANVYDFLFGLTLAHHQILPQSEIDPGMTANEYNLLLDYMMQHSHQNAEIAALRYLHLPVRVEVTGLEVISVQRQSLAYQVLRPGDVITAINGLALQNHPDRLISYLAHAKVGQTVRLQIVRGTRSFGASTRLISLPPVPGVSGPRAGVGFFPATAEKVITPIKIAIHSGNINGPSAGLMFALEVINQLYKGGDLTRGYKIAGTGTIGANGTVGQIGGAAHKVIAANNAGAKFFLVPADIARGDTNALHAEQEVKKLGLKVKVVPVRSLAQAIAFLKSLPQKTG